MLGWTLVICVSFDYEVTSYDCPPLSLREAPCCLHVHICLPVNTTTAKTTSKLTVTVATTIDDYDHDYDASTENITFERLGAVFGGPPGAPFQA